MSSVAIDGGRFITFEGGEGAGKSTQIAALAEHLRSQGYTVRTTREPGGTELGEAVRGVLMGEYEAPMPAMSELLLIFAARAAHLLQVIEPALDNGEIVLCDRFTDASFAYQGVARGLGEPAVATLERLVQGERRPDGVLVLDLPVEQGLARARSRGEDNRFDHEAVAFHTVVRETYQMRARANPERYALIDAAGSSQQVSRAVIAAAHVWL
ncbi:dTMP kinase [Salinisphaera sp. SPP-AMP-43]|uniref:dTMP kinase n=1 Tax=Salinisphaera sp. SPP-AMP-43 TaxID=3121288 RepID=UPI003C6E8E89